MDMNAMYQLKDMLCREVDEIVEKGELSAGDLDTAWKLTDTVKNIYKIKMLEEADEYSHGYGKAYDYDMDDGVSYRGYGRESGYGRASGNSYERGNSYRGRNSMGRYTRDDGAKQTVDSMQQMLNSGHLDNKQRDTIRKAMEMLK